MKKGSISRYSLFFIVLLIIILLLLVLYFSSSLRLVDVLRESIFKW